QSMFILPKKHLADFRESTRPKNQDIDSLTSLWSSRFDYLSLREGQVLFFWHALPHGNGINRSKFCHWSLNLRLKNLFTPYGEKEFGDYFVPYKKSLLTQMTLECELI